MSVWLAICRLSCFEDTNLTDIFLRQTSRRWLSNVALLKSSVEWISSLQNIQVKVSLPAVEKSNDQVHVKPTRALLTVKNE